MGPSADENRVSMPLSEGGSALPFIWRGVVLAVALVAIVWWSNQDEYIYRWDRTFLGILIGCVFWLIVSSSRGCYKKSALAAASAIGSGALLLLWHPVYPKVPASVPPSARNLRNIISALRNYEQAHDRFPPAYT